MNSDHGFNFLGIRFDTSSTLVNTIILVVLIVAYSVSACWVYGDAKRRGKDPFLACLLLTFVGWPLSFLWWLWLRPLTEEERKAKSIKESSGDCPRCGTSLSGKSSCPNCQWQPTETEPGPLIGS
jgi:hypothetical protein